MRIEKEELQLAIAFIVGLVLWLFAGVPLLNTVVKSQGVIIAYLIWLAIYVFFAVVIGKLLSGRVNNGAEVILLLLVGFFISDIWTPPILVPFSGATTLAPEQSIASDVFVYTLFSNYVQTPHYASWILTYIIVPSVLIFLLAFILGRVSFFRTMRGAV